MQYSFDRIDKESLSKLYCEFGFRLKEIGAFVGVSEDAVLKQLKKFNLPTNPRDKQRVAVDVLYTGKKKDKKKTLSDTELARLCKIGYTDAAIGEMFNMTGEGIAYRRKRIGIALTDKFNEKKEIINNFKNTPKKVLEYDYYNLNQEEFSDKYGVSKIVWRPYIKDMGIQLKTINRIESYPSFTKEQRSLIIGGLLGDGSVSSKTRYHESHSNKQRLYLLKKYNMMEPYSSNLYPCDDNSGLRFTTINHPNFLEFYNLFYDPKLEGKLIPVDFIKNNWSDEILAYWFFDDGYYDDVTNEFFINNFCPKIDQLEALISFLNERYDWSFRYSFFTNIYNITFSKDFYADFVNILLKVATPDLYYKIPEKYLTPEMVSVLSFTEIFSIKPKFYRLASEENKLKMEILLFNHFRKEGFPYSKITDKRLCYLLETFKNIDLNVKNSVLPHNASGVKLCEHFFPNIYECSRSGHQSPIEQWNNDQNLRQLIKNRLSYADRINGSTFRTGIKLLFNAVTNFKPQIAKYLYRTYALNGRVLDYSCGFGSRMLAAMSLDMEYWGCEPNLKTLDNLNVFGNFLKKNTKGSFFVTPSGSEESPLKENYFDFAFSSPPFFDYEIYSQDPGQSVVKFPVYDDWLINFWKKTINNCIISLTAKGHFGACVSINKHGPLIESTKKFCSELGLSPVAEFRAPYKQLFHENQDKYDLIMIFKK
jgi:LAGLIDADG DNA endonuclease family